MISLIKDKLDVAHALALEKQIRVKLASHVILVKDMEYEKILYSNERQNATPVKDLVPWSKAHVKHAMLKDFSLIKFRRLLISTN